MGGIYRVFREVLTWAPAKVIQILHNERKAQIVLPSCYHMAWNGVHHVHYTIPMDKEEETLDFWTEVMGFDVTMTIDRPDGRKVISMDDGTNSHVYIFSVDFENSDHTRQDARQTAHSWLDPDDHGWLNEGIDLEARNWVVGFHHLAWGVDDSEELEPIKEKLEEHDIPYRIINRHNHAINIYFPEPVNGINLEVYSPGPEADSSGRLSDMEHGTTEEEIQTTEALEEGHTVEEAGIVRKGSRDGVARRLQ